MNYVFPDEPVSSKMWRTAFWMKHYQHKNFKRTKIWSTSFAVWRLNLGRLDVKKVKNGAKTVRKYQTKSGKAGNTATGDLKKTQYLDCYELLFSESL